MYINSLRHHFPLPFISNDLQNCDISSINKQGINSANENELYLQSEQSFPPACMWLWSWRLCLLNVPNRKQLWFQTLLKSIRKRPSEPLEGAFTATVEPLTTWMPQAIINCNYFRERCTAEWPSANTCSLRLRKV